MHNNIIKKIMIYYKYNINPTKFSFYNYKIYSKITFQFIFQILTKY